MTTPLLEIRDLHVTIKSEGKEILKGISLTIPEGEVHAIMGPNGSGKSTLSNVLAGREDYEITSGHILYKGKDLTELAIEERAAAGIFLAFQYPTEIPGVTTMTFLKTAVNAQRKARGEDELNAVEFLKLVRAKAKSLNVSEDMLKRPLNVGFSGGEKKRAETLQMSLFEPALAVLDETDSGLDIDALKVVAEGVNALRAPNRSMIVITHYQRLLDYIVPDHVHVLAQGRIIRSGGKELALELEETGYAGIVESAA
ncbi:MAG: Fe-S cluster assembly ATPase SufC [Alphaproteobacteria bacterium]|mgnify:FL=1|nr:Fe-S cluster assembly ATPase SufC [Rhodobiaceae bacterium]MBO6541950.1 Fe-S cluster assembly ATPase SufC [Alphaproteobacteria bacterium]MBO6628120.1 Fe-S cluster assembly ATPase SufC [Alphaproteobacteria bacterium]